MNEGVPATRSRSALALLGLAALAILALALRLWALDAVPNPCGDEGNWTWIAFDLWKGRPAALPPDARFVSLAFARLIALSYSLLGPSFAAARAVCVAGVLAGLLGAYAACAKMGLRRAGLCVAAVLAVHPWAVLWSRTVTVPYALALATGTAGPLAYLAALRVRDPRHRALALVLAAQVLFLGVHFTPLALLAIGACALWTLLARAPRALLRTPAPWVALALGALHLCAVVPGALAVAAGASGRPRHYFTAFPLRLYTYFRTALGGLAGQATLRHFTDRAFPSAVEAALVVAVLALVALAARGGEPSAPRAPGAEGSLRSFALLYLGVAAVGAPFVLAPARPWNLSAIDAERYLFVFVAPFALVLGALAESPRRAARGAAWAFVAFLLVGPTARAGWAFARGGGTDHGFYLLHGGAGERGWKVARERVALPWLLRAEVLARPRGTILVADYAFHTLHFANAERGYPTVDVTKFGMPRRPGGRFYFVLWSDGLFAPGFDPPTARDANAMLRERMAREFDGVALVRRWVQPDGAPLVELWSGLQR